MTKRDFFIVIIKLFGLFSLVTSLFQVLPSNISFILRDMDFIYLIGITLAVLVVLALFVVLIFKADKVVEILKLDKGFDEERIEFGNLNSVEIVKIGCFIIGGLILIENLPYFLNHTLNAFREKVVGMDYSVQDNFYWAVSGINLVLGYLLLTNYTFFAKLLSMKKNEND